jgi:hypothetical protein
MISMNDDQSLFAVFCIESLADALQTTGDVVYRRLVDDSDILDSYIIRHYDALHTQGRDYIVRELMEVMQSRGVTL